MTRTRVRFSCTECGAQAPKWLGRCPECGGWDTLAEESVPELRRSIVGRWTHRPAGAAGRGRHGRGRDAAHRDRRAGPGARRRARRRVGHAARRRARDREEHAHAPGARAAWRQPVRECCSSPQRSRRSRCGCAPSGSTRIHPNLLIVAETSLPHVLTHVAEVAPDVLAVDSIQTVADPDVPGRSRFGQPGARVRAPAGPHREGPQHPHAARRPRHEGRRDRRSAHARAHRGHGARVRRRPAPRAAHAARAQAPVRFDP